MAWIVVGVVAVGYVMLALMVHIFTNAAGGK